MSRTRAVRAATVLTALVCALALGGCSGDPEPKFATPSETTTAPSPTESESADGPVEPTLPEAAKGFDGAAAVAFVKFYWEMVNYAQATGDLSGLESISGEGCRACDGGLDYLRKVSQRGGTIDGGAKTVLDAESLGYSKYQGVYRDASVEFTLRSTKQVVTYANERDPDTYAGGTVEMKAIARKIGGQWRMLFWSAK